MSTARRIAVALVIVGIAAAVFVVQSQRTAARRPHPPKPAVYPFDDARKIAQAGLGAYLGQLRAEHQGDGFESADALSRVTLGKPYVSYAFDLWAMPSLDKRDRFRDDLNGGTYIGFPILVDGEPRANISVVYRDQKWAAEQFEEYRPMRILKLQNRLAARGITDRVDLVLFGPSWSVFGIVDYRGQTMLVPLEDEMKNFPGLDFSGDHMYTLDEILPIINERARALVIQLDRENREFEEHYRNYPTSIPATPESPPPTERAPQPEATSTVTPEPASPTPQAAP